VFEALAAHTPVGIFVSSAEGDCLYVNQRWCELTGLSREQALGTAGPPPYILTTPPA